VQRIVQKEKRGESLTTEERAYLERGKDVLRKTQQRAAANTPDRFKGMEGDGFGERVFVAPVNIPEPLSPVIMLQSAVKDGHETRAACRLPAGDSVVPVFFWIHGGLSRCTDEKMKTQVTRNPVFTRILARGYGIVFCTFRTYEHDPQDEGPILDALGMIEKVRSMPRVDTNAVFVCGGSGGGSIALSIASRIRPAGIIVGEPATVIYTGMLTTGDYAKRLAIMKDPGTYYTSALQEKTLERMRNIQSPILMLHGDVHDLYKLNIQYIVPQLTSLGKTIDVSIYPGMKHGFYDGNEAPLPIIERVVSEADTFMKKHGARPLPMMDGSAP
jgi:acetyl esterase/lipase